MAKENFDEVMESVFAHEGGYVNHSKDPGGETNFGISKRSYPKENIKGLTKARAKFLYRRDFWNPIAGDHLQPGVDLVTMDASVNSGASRGVRWTQQASGLTGKAVDGIMGPKSVRTVLACRPVPLIQKACSIRMGFLHGLRTWGTFGKGWSRRVAGVEARAVAMVTLATGGDALAGDVLRWNADKAEGARKNNTKSGHVTAGGGVGGAGSAGGTDLFSGTPEWLPIAFVAATILVAIWFYGKSRHAANRAEAYRLELNKVT